MSKELSLVIQEGIAFQTAEGMARLVTPDHEPIYFTLDDLGLHSEWLAVAWENLAGEEYRPVSVSDRGYVAEGEWTLPKSAVVKRAAPLSFATAFEREEFIESEPRLERDCE